MYRGAWQATVHGIPRVRHDLVSKSPPLLYLEHILTQSLVFKLLFFFPALTLLTCLKRRALNIFGFQTLVLVL